jgi:hypothetical protein
MNYLCKYQDSGEYFVISKSTKDLSQYIGKSIRLSSGGSFYTVIQEIEIR